MLAYRLSYLLTNCPPFRYHLASPLNGETQDVFVLLQYRAFITVTRPPSRQSLQMRFSRPDSLHSGPFF